MKHADVYKKAYLILLALILAATAVAPAAAQGPEGEESDVGVAVTTHGGFGLNPASTLLNPQVVPSGGTATTEFTVTDVEDLYAVNVAFDYDPAIVEVAQVQAGSLFGELTPGVDYLMQSYLNLGAPLAPGDPPMTPGWRRTYVNIAIINYNNPHLPIRGNGSLIKIQWNVQAASLGAKTRLFFRLAQLTDEFGNRIKPSIPPALPVHGFLRVGPPSGGLIEFQVALEGGKPTDGLAAPSVDAEVEATLLGGGPPFVVPVAGGRASLPGGNYQTVVVRRAGYVSASGQNIGPGAQINQVTLLAGDITGDGAVNIFDITLMASNFNAPVGTNPVLERMDFNNDRVMTIVDLALAAKNYGLVGPTPLPIR